jgi:hypothetical protein
MHAVQNQVTRFPSNFDVLITFTWVFIIENEMYLQPLTVMFDELAEIIHAY